MVYHNSWKIKDKYFCWRNFLIIRIKNNNLFKRSQNLILLYTQALNIKFKNYIILDLEDIFVKMRVI